MNHDLPPPPPSLDPREPPAPTTSTPHRTPSRAHHVPHGSSNPSSFGSDAGSSGVGVIGSGGVPPSHVAILGPVAAVAARSARSSPVGSRASSPAPAVGSPLGRAAEEIINQEASNSSLSNLLSPLALSQDPASMIFERDVTLFPPPTDLTHKPPRLGSHSPHHHHHHHGDALDGKVPTVLDDAIQALSGEGPDGPGFFGMGGTEEIEIEGPVSAVHWRTRPVASARQSGTSDGGFANVIDSSEKSITGSHLPPTDSSPLPIRGVEDAFGVFQPIPTALSSPESQASNLPPPPPPTRPQMVGPQPSIGPLLPGAFPWTVPTATTPGGPAFASPVKDWKRKVKDWVGPKPDPGVFPDEVEEVTEERGRPDGIASLNQEGFVNSRTKSMSPISTPPTDGHLLQSQPMTPTFSQHREKRRISFVSYNDLLQSIPTTISPLSEIANGHIEPDHLPGTVSPVRAGSPYLDAPNSHSGIDSRALGMLRASEPNLSGSERRFGTDRAHGIPKASQAHSGDLAHQSAVANTQPPWTPLGTSWHLWMDDPRTQRFFDRAKSIDGHSKTAEQDLEEDFVRSAESLVPLNLESEKGLLVLRRMDFDRVHEEGTWMQSVPRTDFVSFVAHRVDEDAKRCGSNASIGSATSTSNRRGPDMPDRVIGWCNGGPNHVASMVEVKWVKKGEAASLASWAKKHKEGLAQDLWCLYVGNTRCNTKLGLLLVNDRFQRLSVSPEGHYLIEVRPGHPRVGQTITDFDDCLFGKDEIPNQLPGRGDDPEAESPRWHAVQRLWHSQRAGLIISQRDFIRNACSQSLREGIALDDVATGLDNQTICTMLQRTETFKSAVRDEKRRRRTTMADANQHLSSDQNGGGKGRGRQDRDTQDTPDGKATSPSPIGSPGSNGQVYAKAWATQVGSNSLLQDVEPYVPDRNQSMEGLLSDSGPEHDIEDDASDCGWDIDPVGLIRKKMLLGHLVVRLVASEVMDENVEFLTRV